MSILSIDVGLKNLALCLMASYPECKDKDLTNIYSGCTVHYWNVINTLDNKDSNKHCVQCNRNAKLKRIDSDVDSTVLYYCKPHYPKDYPIKLENKIIQKKVKDFLLQDIAKLIIQTIDDVWKDIEQHLDQLKKIVIELQPRVNNKMKFVSHIVYGKIVEQLIKCNKLTIPVRFISATKKLRVYTGPYVACHLKGDYAKRKYLSIKYTEWFLNSQESSEKWSFFFSNHFKKDDLADCFLMCLHEMKK